MTTSTTNTVSTTRGRVGFAESGEGPPLVILHSLLTDRRVFDRVVPDLGGRKVLLDLPGFGQSDPVGPAIDDLADVVADAIRLICDHETPVVMGNGLGAFVALGMAIRHPGSISRLVLVGCGATFPEDARPALQKMIELVSADGMEAVTPVALRRIFTEDYLTRHPEEADERTRVLAATDPAAFIDACRALHDLDFTADLASMTTPTLIVVGEDDQATPPAMAERLHELMPDSRLSVVPGVAHAPQLQDPKGFVRAIEKFMEGE